MKEKAPRSHWVVRGEEEHSIDNPTVEQMLELHKQAYKEGFLVDVVAQEQGKDVVVVFHEIVVDAASQERIKSHL